MADVYEGTFWRHLKTGGVYQMMMRVTREDDLAELIVYRSTRTGQLWCRPSAEFFDGRFEALRWQAA